MSSGYSETRVRILQATWQLLEQRRGQGVRMQDVAEAAAVSRQTVYLHFGSRPALMVATARYADKVQGRDERLRQYQAATTGVARLETFVAFWGNHIPEIYGIAKALSMARETDEAAAAAWEDRIGAVRQGCRDIIQSLQRGGQLAGRWSPDEATDLLWTMLSIHNWESLTQECGWTTHQYVSRVQAILKRVLLHDVAEGGRE